MCSTHFCLSLPLFCTTKTSSFLVTHYFYGGIAIIMCLPNTMLNSCVHVCFYFLLALIYTLLAAPCWPLAFLIFSPRLWIFTCFFLRNSSPLFSITRSSSFSFIHVSVNIKNNVEKETTLLLRFPFQIKLWVVYRMPYLSIELFCVDIPVVRTDGRSGGRAYRHVTTKISRMHRLPNFLTHGIPLRAL